MNTPHWALVVLNEASNSGVLVLSECPLWKDTYSGLLSIFQLGYLVFDIACMNCLYILDMSHLAVI